MFYAYVHQLPMVKDNLALSRGDRLVFSCGILRRSRPDPFGFRAFVLEDKVRGVSYRVGKSGMLVDYHGCSDFIRNPEELKYTPFATGDASETNAFLTLCGRMAEEHKARTSWVAKAKAFVREPIGKVILAGAVAYTVATIIVLVMG